MKGTMTTAELAEAIGVSRDTIIRRAKSSLGKEFAHGATTEFTIEEVAVIIDAIKKDPLSRLTKEQLSRIVTIQMNRATYANSAKVAPTYANSAKVAPTYANSAKVAPTYANSTKVAPKPDKFEQDLRNAVEDYLLTYNARKQELQHAKEAFEQTKQDGEQLMNALYAKTNILDWEQHVSKELAKMGN